MYHVAILYRITIYKLRPRSLPLILDETRDDNVQAVVHCCEPFAAFYVVYL